MVLLLFCLALFLFLFIGFYNYLCNRFHIYDYANYRSSHKGKINTGGGVIFLIITSIYFFLYSELSFFFYVSFFLICCLGYLDDLRIIKNSKKKLAYQFFCLLIILLEFHFSPLLLFIPVLFLVVLNSYNFMDGINGMIGLFTLFLLPILIIFNIKTPYFDKIFFYFIIIGLLVFGYANFRKKAILFAGNIGSFSIGFLVSFLLLKLFLVTNSTLVFSLIIIFLADSMFTILYRLYKKKNIFKPHRMHIYEQLVDVTKLSHLQVSFIYVFFQLFINIVILINIEVLTKIELKFNLVIFSILLVVYSIMVYYLENLKLHKAKRSSKKKLD